MIETISNEDVRDILSMGRDMADLAGKAGRDKQNPGISRVEATVTAVNGDGSLTVNLGSSTKQILRTFKMTSACYGAQVGDRVIVDTLNHISYITGILVRDNGHYVKGECRIVTGSTSFEWKTGNNLHVFMTSSEYAAIAGRSFDMNRDFAGIMNGMWAANGVVPAGAIYNNTDGNLYCSFLKAPVMGSWVRVNYLLAIGL